jgi:predicted MFS family arabinose efflux permease
MGPEVITSWRVPLLVTSGVAVGAGLLVAAFVRNGPYPFPAAQKLAPLQVVEVLRTSRVLLPILGYVGHQVEVMTMWIWLAPFLVEVHGVSERRASLLAFLAVTMGGPGS